MTHLVQRRLQVFVSSTYTDLIDVRQAAVEAVLSCGHIPAGMELFTAGDDSQMEVIKKWIDQSDVYLLILGGRYGSLHPKEKKSYTQLEFEYAAEKNIPRFACVMTEECLKKRVKEHELGTSYIETDNGPKLKAFRKAVTSAQVVKFWNNTTELKLAIVNKLNELQRDPDLVGWIRSNSIEATSPAVSEELARLSRENDLLRKQVANTNDCIGEIPFETIKDMLFEDEEMINVFWNMSEELLGGGVTGISDEDESTLLLLLLELNLVVPDRKPDGAIYYSFNDNGRRFVSRNKLEFFEEDKRANAT